ncbi:MAG: capsular biosynthesis protein [Bacteroidales bacterium]|nr:capsular biosynthesis protein [Bacteroidales bacterium]
MKRRFKQSAVWRLLRECKVLAEHRRVAGICRDLIDEYSAQPCNYAIRPKVDLGTDMIIWQYWSQGFNQVPSIVRKCLESVEKNIGDYKIIRLSDDNITDYLDIPSFVLQKRTAFNVAMFSDILRLMLLKAYGGVWLDATVFLSKPIPSEYYHNDVFFYRRDPKEPDYKYWRNTYAYYFGWTKGFRVNMLNSILFAKKDNPYISYLCNVMLFWWQHHNTIPYYFFFQILCDVYGYPLEMPLVSDTLPHYLQQAMNDSHFKIMSRDDILDNIPIHKLTYK